METTTEEPIFTLPKKMATKSDKHDPHHLQRAWLARLKHDKVLVTVQTVNSSIPIVSVRVKDFDQYTVCLVQTMKDSERIFVLFKHAIVGFEVFASELSTEASA